MLMLTSTTPWFPISILTTHRVAKRRMPAALRSSSFSRTAPSRRPLMMMSIVFACRSPAWNAKVILVQKWELRESWKLIGKRILGRRTWYSLTLRRESGNRERILGRQTTYNLTLLYYELKIERERERERERGGRGRERGYLQLD